MAQKSVFCFLILLVGTHCSVSGHPGLDVVEVVEETQNASDVAPDKFISGGKPAQVGQFPWIARLSIRDRQARATFMCAGTLISKRHVLTAAHCVANEIEQLNDVEIYLGEYDRNTYPMDCVQDKCTKNLIVFPDKIMRHAQYNPRTSEHDIALLRLRREAPLGGAIQAISLPPFDVDAPVNDGVDVLVAGWGDTENGESSDILLTTELKLISQEKCLRLNSDVPRGHLCAGDANGRDTCPGDSGGPLMMYYRKKYYLSGVVSYGPNVRCGTSKAGYYTNVFKYMKWIKTNMKV